MLLWHKVTLSFQPHTVAPAWDLLGADTSFFARCKARQVSPCAERPKKSETLRSRVGKLEKVWCRRTEQNSKSVTLSKRQVSNSHSVLEASECTAGSCPTSSKTASQIIFDRCTSTRPTFGLAWDFIKHPFNFDIAELRMPRQQSTTASINKHAGLLQGVSQL